MIKIIFICLGNICRSPMAEFVFKDLISKKGLSDKFYVESAATSNEEVGHGMHYGTVKKLKENQIPFDNRKARKFTKSDYEKFDYILCMENSNIRAVSKIINADTQNKVHRLLDFSKNSRDIADPWYTGNFDITYDDILEGCNALLEHITGLQK